MAFTQKSAEFADRNWQSALRVFRDKHKDSDPKKIQSFLEERTGINDVKATCLRAQNTASAQYSPALGGILQKVEAFMNLGDLAMKSAPESIGLAWTGIRLCLRSVEDDFATFELFSSAGSDIVGIMLSCTIYARMYGEKEGPDEFQEAHLAVTKLIPEIYVDILEFSYSMKKHMGTNKTFRVAKGIFLGAFNKFESQIKGLKEHERTMTDRASRAHEQLSLYYIKLGNANQEENLNYSKIGKANQEEMLEQLASIRSSLETAKEVNDEKSKLMKMMEDERKSMRKKSPWELAKDAFEENWKQLNSSSQTQDVVLAEKLEQHDKSTCQWVFKVPEYTAWIAANRDGQQSMLWVSGQGGFGKSILMAVIISRMRTEATERGDAIVHYFFISKNDDSRSKSESIQDHIIAQLYSTFLDASLDDLDSANSLMKRFLLGRKKASAKSGNLESSQKNALSFAETYAGLAKLGTKRLFLVVDAIDECTDRQNMDFLKTLKTACDEAKGGLRILVCGRPEVDIQNSLEQVPVIAVEKHNAEDIKTHAEAELRLLPGWKASERELAATEIVKRAGAYFKYVDVAMDIMKMPWQRPIENKLKELTIGLPNIYSQVFSEVDERYLELLKVCLSWVIRRSVERITVDLVIDVFSGRYATESDEDVDDIEGVSVSHLYIDNIRRAGASFLEVDADTRAISLAHATVEDFFKKGHEYEHKAEAESQQDHEATCTRCRSRQRANETWAVVPKDVERQMATTIFQHLNSATFRKRYYPADILAQHQTYLDGKAAKAEADAQGESKEATAAQETEASVEGENEGGASEIDTNRSNGNIPEIRLTNGNGDSDNVKQDSASDSSPQDSSGNAASSANTQTNETTPSSQDQQTSRLQDSDIDNGTTAVAESETAQDNLDTSTNDDTRAGAKQPSATSGPPQISISIEQALSGDSLATTRQAGDATLLSPTAGPNEASDNVSETTSVANQSDSDMAVVRQNPAANTAENDDTNELNDDMRYEIVCCNAHLRQAEIFSTEEERNGPLWEPLWEQVDKFFDNDSDAFRTWFRYKLRQKWLLYDDDEVDTTTPLHVACMNQAPALVERLIKRGADVNARTACDRTPLIFATYWQVFQVLDENGIDVEQQGERKYQILKMLLDAGADPNVQPSVFEIALHRLLRTDPELRLVQLFLEKGARCDLRDCWGWLAIHNFALCATSISVLDELLKAGSDINSKTAEGEVALHMILYRSDVPSELLKALIERGADVNLEDDESRRPLARACSEGHVDAVKILLDAGADMEDDGIDGSRAIHVAALSGNLGAVRILAGRGADLGAVDNRGRTALYLACECDSSETAMAILQVMMDDDEKSGAAINSVTNIKKSALRKAAARNHLDVVDAIIKHNKLHSRDSGLAVRDRTAKWTPLHAAAYYGNASIIGLLIESGADPASVDRKGCIPLKVCYTGWTSARSEQYAESILRLIDEAPKAAVADLELLSAAAIQGSLPVLEKLLALGADPRRVDEHGWTPLQLATQYNHKEAANLLGSQVTSKLKPFGWQIVAQTPQEAKDLVKVPADGGSSGDGDSTNLMDVWGPDGHFCVCLSRHPIPSEMRQYYFEVEVTAGEPQPDETEDDGANGDKDSGSNGDSTGNGNGSSGADENKLKEDAKDGPEAVTAAEAGEGVKDEAVPDPPSKEKNADTVTTVPQSETEERDALSGPVSSPAVEAPPTNTEKETAAPTITNVDSQPQPTANGIDGDEKLTAKDEEENNTEEKEEERPAPPNHDNMAVCVGFTQTGSIEYNWIPGWMNDRTPGQFSWALHSDDGSLRQYPTVPPPAVPMLSPGTWGCGDVVGCGVDFRDGRIFFTKNGDRLQQTAFVGVRGRLHPVMTLWAPWKKAFSVKVNFGNEVSKPFRWQPADGDGFKIMNWVEER